MVQPDLEFRLAQHVPEIILKVVQEGRADYELFLGVGENLCAIAWAMLGQSLDGEMPTTDQLIESEITAYRTVYHTDPTIGDFRVEEDFTQWLDQLESRRRVSSDHFDRAYQGYVDANRQLGKFI